MEKSLYKSITETPLFASFPMAFICDKRIIDDDSNAEKALFDMVKTLHSISLDEDKMSNFYNVIDKDDFIKINLFLTERLYCLIKLNKQ
jgi:hypothetical protein